jgi:hypothetical protein
MGTTSEQLLMVSGRAHAFFDKMSNIAETLEREGVKIDKKVEEKMCVNEGECREDVILRLVEEIPEDKNYVEEAL